ncbi:MAG: hypothetical protein HY978_04495 [Candidatus Liptonbacteria bacterium]|nr:hypothetical protein [Candidatus Liptonbacteria bacterium]
MSLRELWIVGRYYFHKAVHQILSELVCFRYGFHRELGLAYGKLGRNFSFSGTILFAFWDPQLIHLGDQLFYEPIIRHLRSRYRLLVAPPAAFREYFEALGVEVVTREESKKMKIRGAVVVSKDDLAYQVRRTLGPGNVFIGNNYPMLRGDEKITVLLARTILRVLQEYGAPVVAAAELSGVDFNPSLPASLAQKYQGEWSARLAAGLPAGSGRGIFAYNAYVASNQLGILGRRKLLEGMARRLRAQGFRIVHIGSSRDRELDPQHYDFVDLDLRGALSPAALFGLFALPDVRGVISFDVFVAHVASLCGKELHVVFKSALLASQNKIRARFLPMFPGRDDLLRE